MSQENVELVRKAVDAWNSGGVDVMRGWNDSFDEYTVAACEIRDLDDKVVWLGEMAGLIRGSEVAVRQPMGSCAWDFRAGKIGKARFFPSWEEALEAAELPE